MTVSDWEHGKKRVPNKKFLSKNNYLIQTDAVKNYLIPVCNYHETLHHMAISL